MVRKRNRVIFIFIFFLRAKTVCSNDGIVAAPLWNTSLPTREKSTFSFLYRTTIEHERSIRTKGGWDRKNKIKRGGVKRNEKKKKEVSVHSRELPLVSILCSSQREDSLCSPRKHPRLVGPDSQRQRCVRWCWSDDETTRNPRCREGPPSVSIPGLEIFWKIKWKEKKNPTKKKKMSSLVLRTRGLQSPLYYLHVQ